MFIYMKKSLARQGLRLKVGEWINKTSDPNRDCFSFLFVFQLLCLFFKQFMTVTLTFFYWNLNDKVKTFCFVFFPINNTVQYIYENTQKYIISMPTSSVLAVVRMLTGEFCFI